VTSGITILGLGPGDPELLTRRAWRLLQKADRVFVRTADFPAISALSETLEIQSFDSLAERADAQDDLPDIIADALLKEAGSAREVLYAVPGDPMIGDSSVSRLRAKASAEKVPLTIVPGISFLEPCLDLLGLDVLDGLQVVDAIALSDAHHPRLQADLPSLLARMTSQEAAVCVKRALMNQYPEDHPLTLLHAAGTADAKVQQVPLHALAQAEMIDYQTVVYVPALAPDTGFESFRETVAHLRAPDGCPWDREQTHESLRMHMLEECYEVLQAIDEQDLDGLCEELGDLLLQIVLQTQIATEQGSFMMADVLAGINAKLKRRHPHVFGDLAVEDVDQVLVNWEALKAQERETAGAGKGAMDGVPRGLPALAQADELQSRAARVGFDWPAVKGVRDKILEELEELQSARDAQEKAAEFGDLLFSLVNYARWMEIDPETVLRTANRRFRERFRAMESAARSQGRRLPELSLEEMDDLWEQIKRQHR